MPLTRKYLKYNDAITFEIFEKIWNKLIENKWYCKNSVKIEYSWFPKYGYILHEEPKEQKNFATHTCIYGLEETTVQEILGYDPFVKEEFVLPEMWCIISKSRDQDALINKFARDSGGSHWDDETNNAKNYYLHITDGVYSKGSNHDRKYTEITFDQFKKYVLKKPIKEPKSIEKWSVGTYVLFLKDLSHLKAGDVDIIKESLDKSSCIYLEKYLTLDTDREKQNMVKWFATKSEAEEFAKTLVEPVKHGNGILDAVEPKQLLKQAVHCKTQEEWDFVTEKCNLHWNTNNFPKTKENCIVIQNNSWDSIDQLRRLGGYQILSFQEWCDLNGYKMEKEVKFEVGKWYELNNCWWAKFHSLKGNSFYMSELITADFKYEKRNPERPANTDLDLNNSIVLASIEEIQQYLPDNHPDKIKSNQEFKVDDYIFVMIKGKNFGDILKVTDSFIEKKSNYSGVWINHKPSSFGGGGFRLNGNGYIYGKDVRHATPEEINNHLISIGQVPAGELLNTGIKSNKNNTYQAILIQRDANPQCTFNSIKINGQEILKPKMTLSIDDEELPMVNIIKTNSIKQLLNNE